MLDEWNEQIGGAAPGVHHLRVTAEDAEPPLFTLEHRAEFLSQ
jgi:hypothetical protein